MVSVYVDDFLLVSKHWKLLDQIKKKLKKEYNVKNLGEVIIIIGCQVTQGISTMKIDQLAFIRNLVEDEGMQNCNPVSTPIKAGNFIEMQGKDGYKEVNFKVY